MAHEIISGRPTQDTHGRQVELENGRLPTNTRACVTTIAIWQIYE